MMSDSAKMHGIRQYLNKQDKTSSFIDSEPDSDLKLIVVIPAFKEQNISNTIDSLYACQEVNFQIEIIVFVNGFSTDNEEVRQVNLSCLKELSELERKYTNHKIKLYTFENLEMLPKFGGVGRARKQLMDEACFRFASIYKEDGLIVNLDADCLVSENYFQAINSFFETNPKLNACSIHFEHLFGSTNSIDAGIDYELHLRYFIGMQKELGLPFAFQTIGSAMASTVGGYSRLGGMNTRKAGEDFYFLHKFIKNNDCGTLTEATVFPSDRVSDRVPFGTGKAIGNTLEGKPFSTYNPQSFIILSEIIKNLERLYDGTFDLFRSGFNKQLQEFLATIDFGSKLQEINKNTTNFMSFLKRFYQFFDAFQLMKYLHFMRDNGYANVTVDEAIRYYLDKIEMNCNQGHLENLKTLRSFDKTVI